MSRWHLRTARGILRAGGVIAYPTEAVYGLGCAPLDGRAVARLLYLKQRSVEKGLLLIAAAFEQVAPLVEEPSPQMLARLEATWPGFTTWILPARPGVPRWLTGQHAGLAVRVTAHPVAAALCRYFGGPLISTSANPGGLPPARNMLKVRGYFADALDYIVPGAVGGEARPSEIRDACSGAVLRS